MPQDPRAQVGQDAERVQGSRVVRERGGVHPRWALGAERLVGRQREGVVGALGRVHGHAQAARQRRAARQLAAAHAQEPGPLRGVQPHQHGGDHEHAGPDRALVLERAARAGGRRAGGGGAERARPPRLLRRRGPRALRLLHRHGQA